MEHSHTANAYINEHVEHVAIFAIIFWHLKGRLMIPLILPSFEGQPCNVGSAPRHSAVRQPLARLPRVLGDSSDAVGGDVPRANQQRFDLFQCSLERLGNCWTLARSSETHGENGTQIPGTKRIGSHWQIG